MSRWCTPFLPCQRDCKPREATWTTNEVTKPAKTILLLQLKSAYVPMNYRSKDSWLVARLWHLVSSASGQVRSRNAVQICQSMLQRYFPRLNLFFQPKVLRVYYIKVDSYLSQNVGGSILLLLCFSMPYSWSVRSLAGLYCEMGGHRFMREKKEIRRDRHRWKEGRRMVAKTTNYIRLVTWHRDRHHQILTDEQATVYSIPT